MIDFGQDFFKWFRFAVELVKLFISIFGDDNDKNELQNNHIDPHQE